MDVESESGKQLVLADGKLQNGAARLFYAAITLALIAITADQIILNPGPQYTFENRIIGGLLMAAVIIVVGFLTLSIGRETVIADRTKGTIVKTSKAIIAKQEWSVRFKDVDRVELTTFHFLSPIPNYAVHICTKDGRQHYVTEDGSHLKVWFLLDLNRKERMMRVAKKLATILDKPMTGQTEN